MTSGAARGDGLVGAVGAASAALMAGFAANSHVRFCTIATETPLGLAGVATNSHVRLSGCTITYEKMHV